MSVQALRIEVWPWPTPNPPRTRILRPVWRPYIVGGKVNPVIAKEIASDASGIYLLRRIGSKQVAYIGESHTGRLRKRLQYHFNACGTHRGQYRGVPRDLCWSDRGKWEVAYFTSDPTRAERDEARAIKRHAPRLNVRHQAEPSADDFAFGANVKANPETSTRKPKALRGKRQVRAAST